MDQKFGGSGFGTSHMCQPRTSDSVCLPLNTVNRPTKHFPEKKPCFMVDKSSVLGCSGSFGEHISACSETSLLDMVQSHEMHWCHSVFGCFDLGGILDRYWKKARVPKLSNRRHFVT